MARTIQSPGVEIREVDLSLRPVVNQGTSVFVTGFASQGPIDEVLQPTSISEFTQIYGEPTNAAERYFYHTVKAALQAPVQLVVTRLPYGFDKGEGFESWKYSAVAYPVAGVSTSSDTRAINLSASDVYFFGKPTHLELSIEQYQNLLNNNLEWSNNPVQRGTSYTLQNSVDTSNDILSATVDLSFNTHAVVFENTGGSLPIGVVENQVYYATQTGTPSGFKVYTNLADAENETNPVQISANGTGTNKLYEVSFPSVDDPFTYNTLNQAGMVVLNKSQTTVNNRFEGYYLGVTDNNNNNPATPFDGIKNVYGLGSDAASINNFIQVPTTRLNFALTATKFGDGGSVSEVMENVSNFDLSPRSFDDTISVGLFKLRQSVFSPDVIALDYVLSESYAGSLDYHRQIASQNGGPAVSFYINNQQSSSPNINTLVNPYINNRYKNTWLNTNGVPSKKVRMLSHQLATPFTVPGFVDNNSSYVTRVGATSGTVATLVSQLGTTDALFPLGVYTNTVTTTKDIGNLPAKLERAFELVENPDLYQINLACEAGLGTIFVNVAEEANAANVPLTACGAFVDTTPLNTLSALYTTNSENLPSDGLRIRANYNAIASIFVNQSQNQRKDFMVILDALRNIFVQGDNNKVINTKKLWGPNAGINPDPLADGYSSTNFSQHIYWPLRHQFSLLDTSYAATYATVAQTLDPVSNRQVWVPFSGFAAAAMGNTDANFQPWFAPAGFTRGVLLGVNDLGVYPKQKQRDQLYKNSLNPVAFFPAEGFVIFGQKTLLKKPSAFDRINVRRLFLNLEVATRNTIKFFVFEPNSLFTRTQVVNTLTPIFDAAKNTDGVYDYLIICDERNNTPDVIDQNEMKVDIYLKPVRAAEFILVSFYATRTSQNFQELLA